MATTLFGHGYSPPADDGKVYGFGDANVGAVRYENR